MNADSGSSVIRLDLTDRVQQATSLAWLHLNESPYSTRAESGVRQSASNSKIAAAAVEAAIVLPYPGQLGAYFLLTSG